MEKIILKKSEMIVLREKNIDRKICSIDLMKINDVYQCINFHD